VHQPLGGKTDHLAQQIGVGALFQKRAKVHHLVGHRWFLESGCVSQPNLTDESSMADRKPLAHYGAMGRRVRSRLAPPSYTTTRDVTACPMPIGASSSARSIG